jgi:hypothetical protein
MREKDNTRRNFLKRVGLASGGVMLFSSGSMLQAFTNSVPYEGYNPFAEEKVDMRTSLNSENHLKIFGKVFSRKKLNPVPHVKLEVWHLSPNSNKYRHQAKMLTSKEGDYQFFTDIPGKQAGKTPRIFFKITGNDGSYFTELIIGRQQTYITGHHWEKNRGLGGLLYPVMRNANINFNITI